MPLPLEYFQANYAFGLAAARVTGLPLPWALQEWTNIPLRLGIDGPDDAARWREQSDSIQAAADPLGRIYGLYLEHRRNRPAAGPSDEPTFGCFRYEARDGGRIRLHFRDNDESGHGPLAKPRAPARRAELRTLVEHAVRHVSGARTLVGCSWLYSIGTYRRLFPPAYIETAGPAPLEELKYYGNWGQFLDHGGNIKRDLVERFLRALQEADLQTAEDLRGVFPCPILSLEAPLPLFVEFYRQALA